MMIEVDGRLYNEKMKAYAFHQKQHDKAAKKLLKVSARQGITTDLAIRDITRVINYHIGKQEELEVWITTHQPTYY